MIYTITKIIGLFCVLTISSCKSNDTKITESSSQVANKWHFGEFKEVRAYRMNWDDEHSSDTIIDSDGKLNETRLPENGVVLNQAQIEKLKAAVTGNHPDHPTAGCFAPHHAFLFFDKSGEVIAHIDICFLCFNYNGSPKGFADFWDIEALDSLIEEIGLPIENKEWD